MKKLLLLILFVLNLVLLQAQKVEFISVNSADTTLQNITFKQLPKLLQKDTLTADTLATPAKWMVKLQKKLTKQQRQDSNIYIFFCHKPQDSVTAFLPLSGKYGYVLFDTAKTGVVELERVQFRLSTWKYQWDLIHNPESMLFSALQDEGEGAYTTDPCLKKGWENWKKYSYEKVANKKNLPYDAACNNLQRTYYHLINGNIILEDDRGMDSESSKLFYMMYVKELKEWFNIDINTFENDCLSCELTNIAATIQKTAGIYTGRYLIPYEDAYILISGKDFDNNESSRIAAGGFLLLEVVQVGKIYKFVKGAKILSKTGKTVSVSSRVVKQFAKNVTEEVIVDISCQLIINLVQESITYPNKTDGEILTSALEALDFKNALIEGMISYTSLDNKTKNSLNCAKDYFSRIESGGQNFVLDIGKGTGDCLIDIGINLAFNKLKSTQSMQGVINAFNNAKSRDIILKRFKSLTGEACYDYIETMVGNNIKSTF